MCQAHVNSNLQPAPPTVCTNKFWYNEASCDLVFNVSKPCQDLAYTKTDLHLQWAQYQNQTLRMNFKSNFGGGLYVLSKDTPPDQLTKCELPTTRTRRDDENSLASSEKKRETEEKG